MNEKILYLPNQGLEGQERFLLVFFNVHINIAFCFYIYGSLQVLSCSP